MASKGIDPSEVNRLWFRFAPKKERDGHLVGPAVFKTVVGK